jgi:hypothetical protein
MGSQPKARTSCPFGKQHLSETAADRTHSASRAGYLARIVTTAAGRFGWTGYKRQDGRGRGFAFARYKNLAAYVALAVEISSIARAAECA